MFSALDPLACGTASLGTIFRVLDERDGKGFTSLAVLANHVASGVYANRIPERKTKN